MSQWSKILDDVEVYLNTLSLSQSFTAINSFKPKIVLNQIKLTDTSVIVFPSAMVRERINRNSIQRTHVVNVVVTRKIDPAILDLDFMVDFCEELAVKLDEVVYTNGRTASTATIEPVYDMDKFNAENLFQSMINVSIDAYS